MSQKQVLPKELVLMVEGQGDEKAVPGLITRLLKKHGGSDCLYVGNTFRIGGLDKIICRENEDRFINLLKSAAKKPDMGAVLLLVDGDLTSPLNSSQGKISFCPSETGRFLAERARESRAGKNFSFAAVFAVQEFESWILAGCPKFDQEMGKKDTEIAPRDAKKQIEILSKKNYDETIDQSHWAKQIDIVRLLNREPKVRSFHRLSNAVSELVNAVRDGQHVSTPCE